MRSIHIIFTTMLHMGTLLAVFAVSEKSSLRCSAAPSPD
jgi:hypothetical protein